ncbi:MAG: MBL fold metallo-hydrolase [Elusimicrobia bacterium]|nr:MBL fold metallo-hydrolase [Elusimicrobiota bacterium]
MSVFTVRFWGTRGSIPAPGFKTSRYGGNTSCVELARNGRTFILDAGTGIRELGERLRKDTQGKPIDADLFITHTHWDHIQGFPFFVPAYVKGNTFRIHGSHGVGRSFEKIFRGLMDPSYFPVDLGDMAASLEFHELRGEALQRDGVEIKTTFTNHPGVDLAYRFSADGKSVTYLTDHETYQTMNTVTEFARKQDRIVEDFCRGSDVLIVDAQYTDDEYRIKRTWGHSRYRDSIRLGIDAEAKHVVLYHHDPSHSDEQMDVIAKDAREIIKASGKAMRVSVAQEGFQIEV